MQSVLCRNSYCRIKTNNPQNPSTKTLAKVANWKKVARRNFFEISSYRCNPNAFQSLTFQVELRLIYLDVFIILRNSTSKDKELMEKIQVSS